MGLQCEVGLRKKTYNVLTGSVLSVWHEIESILTHDGNRKGTNSRMQVCFAMEPKFLENSVAYVYWLSSGRFKINRF